MSDVSETSFQANEPIPQVGSVHSLDANSTEYLPDTDARTSSRRVSLKAEFLERHHSGPLPAPDTLAEYERILPGAAERIFSRFEKQSDHRMSMEAQAIGSNAFSQRVGTIGSVVFAFAALLGSVYLVHEGKDLGGLTVFIGTVGSVAGTFVYGKHTQRNERENALRLRSKAEEAEQGNPQNTLPE